MLNLNNCCSEKRMGTDLESSKPKKSRRVSNEEKSAIDSLWETINNKIVSYECRQVCNAEYLRLTNSIPIEKVPDEILLKTFSELDVKDLKSLSSVSKNISRLAQNPFLIKSKFPEKYNEHLPEAFCTFDPSKKDEFIKKNKIALAHADSLDLHAVTINKDLIEFINKNCPSVKLIGLPFATTDETLKHLKGLPNLTSLDLSFCDQITDAGLKHLKDLPNLTSLNLSGCWRITNAGLEHLKSLTNLTSLDLRDCSKITDAGLGHISGLTNLTSLELGWCDQITNDGVNWLKKHLPNLKIYRK